MNGQRLLWHITALVAVTLILTSCANGGRSGMDMPKSKQDAEAVLFRVFDVPGSVWSSEERQANPASTVCTFNRNAHGGVQYHWFVNGSAARAATVLKGAGFSTNRSTSELTDKRPLYFVGGESSSGAQVALIASAMNTVLQVSSTCADGAATDFE